MKTCAFIFAAAEYAASAPAAFPALGTATSSKPNRRAIETATLIPRALKLPVGLTASSLMYQLPS
jgi:hypothetical protein